MDSFHRHLDELERLLSDDDKKKRRIKESVLCYAAYFGSSLMVEALIEKGVGKECTVMRIISYRIEGNFCWVQIFAIFADRPASVKIKTAKRYTKTEKKLMTLPVYARG